MASGDGRQSSVGSGQRPHHPLLSIGTIRKSLEEAGAVSSRSCALTVTIEMRGKQ
jgi:hypothetical protein